MISSASFRIALAPVLLLGAALCATGPTDSRAAALVADYQFNGDLSSSVGGAPSLTFPASTGISSNGSGTYAFGSGNVTFDSRTGFGLDVSSILSGYYDNYTLAIRFQLPDPNQWRGLSFTSPSVHPSADDGFQVEPTGKMNLWTNSSSHSFAATNDIVANTYFQALFALSNSSGTYSLLGVLGTGGSAKNATFNLGTNAPEAFLVNSGDPSIAFFRDYYQDQTRGTVDRIQIYQGAMTLAEAQALDLSAIPEPASLVSLGLLLCVRRRRR